MVLTRTRISKVLAFVIAFVFVVTMAGISTTSISSAATKKPKSITLSVETKTIDVQGQAYAKVKSVKPAKASKAVTWKSSNKAVATVDSSGLITGVKEGTVKITATSKKAKKVKKSVTITIKDIQPTGMSIEPADIETTIGASCQLDVTLEPVGVYNQGLEFSTSDRTVARVDEDGAVALIGEGQAEISVQAEGDVVGKVPVNTIGKVLSPWVMTGLWSADKINGKEIAEDADVLVWNQSEGIFEDIESPEAAIVGNYTEVCDTDEDKVGDTIMVVNYEDGKAFWDAKAKWEAGAGEMATGDEPLDDETGEAMFNKKFRVPMGERLLTNYGLKDYSGTTDWGEYDAVAEGGSPYWENAEADYYNLDSSKTLTMLTGYKTELQTTGYNCVMSSALTVLDWYGERGDLNEHDLQSLKYTSVDSWKAGGGSSLTQAKNLFRNLYDLGLTCKWNMESWDGNEEGLYDSDWIQEQLSMGHPIMVIWNSWGAHGQVIIGYDNMGTDDTLDDVLILMDPYDTTDHNADGYTIQSYERLAYGLLTWSDQGTTGTKYLAVWPKSWEYDSYVGDGLNKRRSNVSDFEDLMKLPYAATADDIQAFYPNTPYLGDNGLAAAAAGGYERSGDHNRSAYYNVTDFYGSEDELREAVGSETLKILDNYKTVQQATEWTCGPSSAFTVIEHFGMNQKRDGGEGAYETPVSLATHRSNNIEGATFRQGMVEMFEYLENEYDEEWVTFTDNDMDDPRGEWSELGGMVLQEGAEGGGLIPWLIDNNIPMMIGWDEWGGHWQTIIGYDDMGTYGTADDVLILVDPYDTTDHNQNGYVIESFERLVYGWDVDFETHAPGAEDEGYNDFVIAVPDTPEYHGVINTLNGE